MKKSINIFVPEWVPLANKGEEAIVLGMADVLFPEQKVTIHLLDMKADHVCEKDGIIVYPGRWFYADWRSREFGFGLSWERFYSSCCSLLRNVLNRITPNWVNKPQYPLKAIEKSLVRFHQGEKASSSKEHALYQIFQCDYIIGGHNGGLNEYVCHTLSLLKKYGHHFGIFGSSLKPKLKEGPVCKIFRDTLSLADFIYVRNPIAKKWAEHYMPEIPVNLCPDPAFGMYPNDSITVDEILRENKLDNFINTKLIAMTVCEPAPIARNCFSIYSSPNRKLKEHRLLLGQLVKHILETTDANILFLPHAIGPEKALDDRFVASEILKTISFDSSRVAVLRADLNGRILKQLIGYSSLLVAERIHSIIGSVKVNTPFFSIGVKADSRIIGIVKDMLKAEENIYYLENPDIQSLIDKFDELWQNLPAIREKQTIINEEILAWLTKAADEIRQIIDTRIRSVDEKYSL